MRPTILRVTSIAVTAAAVAAGVVLVALMILTTADVIGRYFFNRPIRGVFDLTHFAVLIMAFLGFAYCGFHGTHVVIEILYHRLGTRTRAVVKRVVSLMGFVLFATITWRAIVAAADIKAFKMASQLMLIPFWPFYYMLAFGAGLYALVLFLYIFVPEPEEGGAP